MTEPQIIDSTDEKANVSRWTKYGKDRLYINRLGKSWDDFYVDLDGGEGHGTPMVETEIERDGDLITVRWTRPEESEREVVIALTPEAAEEFGDKDDNDEGPDDDPTESADESVPAEVPDAVPYNAQTAGMAQQINAQRLFSNGDE